MLLYFQRHFGRLPFNGEIHLKSFVDLWQFAFFNVELGINDRADDLNDGTCFAHELLVCWKG